MTQHLIYNEIIKLKDFKSPHSHTSGCYSGPKCSKTLTLANSSKVSIIQSETEVTRIKARFNKFALMSISYFYQIDT